MAPKDFHHPYVPYDIQLDFMSALYDCISEGQVGIFESPTGTGKSLSILCGALTWLRDEQQKIVETSLGPNHGNDEPNWILEHAKSQQRTKVLQNAAELEVRLKKVREQENIHNTCYKKSEPFSKRRKLDRNSQDVDNDEARYVLDDYDSEEDRANVRSQAETVAEDGLSMSSRQLMERLGMTAKPAEEEKLAFVDTVKVYYSSRTHSQLTQFVNELRRVQIPSEGLLDPADLDSAVEKRDTEVKHLSLGSRKNLCINPKVSQIKSAVALNERCLELQQPTVTEDHKCPFMPNKEKENLVADFRDHTMAKIRDIEDLGALGKRLGICPYYASRATIKPSEIITLPYPLLLQESAREALGISLKGHIVIIDEAHNLMDAITGIYSVAISRSQLKRCRTQIGVYLQKFRNKLKGKNRVYVTQVVRLIDSLSGYLDTINETNRPSEGIVRISDLSRGKGTDQINLYKLMRYLQESKLARKVEGYIGSSEANRSHSKAEAYTSPTPVLMHFQSFLVALTNPESEGRFFYEKIEHNDVMLKYMLLDPSHHFKTIVEDARAVILSGGTMSPMEDYIRHLFSYVQPQRLRIWSCGHIIPKDNLIAWPVMKGPGGTDLDFTFDKRKSGVTIDALGACLTALAKAIPDGLVVFFPSYSYLDQVVTRWQVRDSASPKTMWQQLLEQKPIFRESKSVGNMDDVLSQYSQSISEGKGGMLLSVVGGKMSEGINFSDKLGRGVVVIGLPFPNIQSAEWKAKLEYIERTTILQRKSQIEGKQVARDFYENACMRAVNQSIGRAIRHRGDFASIILLDRRYGTSRVTNKLPVWIRDGLVDGLQKEFDDVVRSVRNFFAARKEQSAA